MENKGNYYAILTATVRHDKRLSSDEKLLYAEITALSNQYGFCWSSNDYLAKIFDCTVQSISRWITNLETYGYLKREIDKAAGNKRKLYPLVTYLPSQSSKQDLLTDQVIPINSQVNTPINPTVKYNSIIDNSINEVESKPSQFQPIGYKREWEIPFMPDFLAKITSYPNGQISLDKITELWETWVQVRYQAKNKRFTSDISEAQALKLLLNGCNTAAQVIASLNKMIASESANPFVVDEKEMKKDTIIRDHLGRDVSRMG
jgi:DNA-binding MarR family transcriptional regulator